MATGTTADYPLFNAPQESNAYEWLNGYAASMRANRLHRGRCPTGGPCSTTDSPLTTEAYAALQAPTQARTDDSFQNLRGQSGEAFDARHCTAKSLLRAKFEPSTKDEAWTTYSIRFTQPTAARSRATEEGAESSYSSKSSLPSTRMSYSISEDAAPVAPAIRRQCILHDGQAKYY